MAGGVEQPASLDRKQRGATDRQLGAELFGREPGVRGRHGSRAAGVGAARKATHKKGEGAIHMRSREGLWE